MNFCFLTKVFRSKRPVIRAGIYIYSSELKGRKIPSGVKSFSTLFRLLEKQSKFLDAQMAYTTFEPRGIDNICHTIKRVMQLKHF